MKQTIQILLILFIGLIANLTFGQNLPNISQPTQFQPNVLNNLPVKTNVATNPMDIFFGTDEQQRIKKQNEQLIREAEQYEIQKLEAQKQLYADLKMQQMNFGLPSKSHIVETQFYRNAFKQLSEMNPDDFSVKKATFLIENAFYEEQKVYEEFKQIVKQTGDFLREKMDELGYNKNSNLAKNFILFQFFADTLEIKSKNLKHLPFEYDFEDYMGRDDYTKIFVTKLLETGSGQCNSLPRLYLVLAEEIGAEAFLSLSPNHSYIKFRDEVENWYNVELTNNMFTLDSFILQSGYIKSEALQNGIYMQTLSNRQLMSVLMANLAMGYQHKFGNDSFVEQVAEKALELYPNLINALMIKANFQIEQFERATNQVGINPRDNADLQNIRFYPPVVSMLNQTNATTRKISELGYEFMPDHAYESWLNSLQQAKQKQDNEAMKRQFSIKLNQLKN